MIIQAQHSVSATISNGNRRFGKLILLIMLYFFFTNNTQAQTRLTGRIFEYKTHTKLGGIKIEDLKTHIIAVSDTNGHYSIRTAIGDKLAFSAMSYKTDTILVVNLKFKEVYLEEKEGQLLKEVRIENKEVNAGFSAIPKPAGGPLGSKTVLYQTDAGGDYRGGVKVGLPGFNSEQKKKEKDARLNADEQVNSEIDRVFSDENIQKYLPLKGQELTNFRILYRPSIKVYQEDFNLTTYLSSSYREFLKIPLEKRQSKDFLNLNHQP